MTRCDVQIFEKRLAQALTCKWRQPYPQVINFMHMSIQIALAYSNTLFLCSAWDCRTDHSSIKLGAALLEGQSWTPALPLQAKRSRTSLQVA